MLVLVSGAMHQSLFLTDSLKLDLNVGCWPFPQEVDTNPLGGCGER